VTSGTAASDTTGPVVSGKSELLVSALLFVLGVVALIDAATLETNAASVGPLSSAVFPTVVGVILLVVGVALAIDVLRGGRGDMEGGEDIDLDQPTAWVPFFAVGGFFLANAVLIESVGWPITGTLLFFGSAVALGSRRYVTTLMVALVIAFGSYLLFVYALGAYLPGGVLEGAF